MAFASNGVSIDSGHTKRPIWQCRCGKVKEKVGGMFPPTCGTCETSAKGVLRAVSAGK